MNYLGFLRFTHSLFVCLFVCLFLCGKIAFWKKLQSHSFLICKLMRKIRSFISSVINQDILARTQWNPFLSFRNFILKKFMSRFKVWSSEFLWSIDGSKYFETLSGEISHCMYLPLFLMEFQIDWLSLFVFSLNAVHRFQL